MFELLCIVEMVMGGLESEFGRLGGLFLNIGLLVCCFIVLFEVVRVNVLLFCLCDVFCFVEWCVF